jgi:hypothetical protein
VTLRVSLQVMRDSDAVGCALAPATPAFPQPGCFECCDPARASFGCDYHGLPPGGAGGGFKETRGSVADVVPFMHVTTNEIRTRNLLIPHPAC